MFDLLQNHMSNSHTIRAHAQEVWDKSDKDYGLLSVTKKVVTYNIAQGQTHPGSIALIYR